MKSIDTHAHIFPQKIERAATIAIRDFYEFKGVSHIGSPEELLESGRKAGVENFVIFSTATTPEQVTAINDFIIGQCRTHPEFIGAGTMHILFADYENEIDRIYGSGIRGIKLHPDFQRFDFDDERLFPIYAQLERKDMFVITHAGDYRYDFSHPEKIARVAAMFPKLRIVAAHFGGWSVWELARRVLKDLPNVYYDTSSTIGFGGVEPALLGLKTFDNTHIFFGCDFPMWDHGTEIRRLQELGLSAQLLEDILYNNFARFYGL